MSATYTNNLRLRKPGTGDLLWGTSYNLDFDLVDLMLGGLAVQTLEVPSTSLKITVAPGPYFLINRFFWHPGTAGVARTLPANSTQVVYLLADEIVVDAGTGVTGHPFPDFDGSHAVIPLAIVITGATTVASITHWRYVPGHQLPYTQGPYANDVTAAANGVMLGQQYYDASGIVHVRLA